MESALADALKRFAGEGPAGVPSAVMTTIADHVRAAVEGDPSITLEQVERELHAFFKRAFAAAPKSTRLAVQGEGEAETAAGFLLGQVAFAHLLAARTLDTRVGQGFVHLLEDKRYDLYLRALLNGPKDGVTLASLVSEKPETVSRKLAQLREGGLVVSRQQGKRVVNKLSPAAKAMLEHKGVQPLRGPDHDREEKERAIDDLAEQTPAHMRVLPVFNQKVA